MLKVFITSNQAFSKTQMCNSDVHLFFILIWRQIALKQTQLCVNRITSVSLDLLFMSSETLVRYDLLSWFLSEEILFYRWQQSAIDLNFVLITMLHRIRWQNPDKHSDKQTNRILLLSFADASYTIRMHQIQLFTFSMLVNNCFLW